MFEMPVTLHKCGKPACFRQVKEGVDYCCTPCSIAAAGKYEIDRHSAWCDERAAQRGPWTNGYQSLARDA
jgi:hypothetical protein